MSGSDLLLDTNAAIAWLSGSREIEEVLRRYRGHVLPIPALAELEFGARRSARPAENIERIEGLLREVKLLTADRRTASLYGELGATLRRKGRPIPVNDLWIAALGLQHDSRLPRVTLTFGNLNR